MKKTSLFGLAFVACAICSACSNDSEEILSQGTEIRLTSEIIPSRVTALDYQSTQIVEGQKVGVTITGASSVHKNVQWTVGAEGVLSNGGDPVFFSGEDEAVITAYHPYDSYYTGTSHLFKVNTNQSTEEGYLASDLLWAKTTSAQTNDAVSLVFSHKLAKVNVTLVPFASGTDLSDITIYICGTKTSTYFNPTDGSLSDYASASVSEIKAGVTAENAYTASAIVIPQTLAAGTQFIRIVQGDKVYSYNVGSQGKELLSGISHNYTLTVKDKGLELVSNNIENWGDDNVEGVIEEQKFSWFNPNQYITYVKNPETVYKGRNTYNYSSYLSSPITKFSKIEFKYEMKESSGSIYLCCRNQESENTSAIFLSDNGLKIERSQYDKDDNDYYADCSYTWNELKVNKTDCMTLTISFKNEDIKLNNESLQYKMHGYNDFESYYIFTYYSSENDEGVWCTLGKGVPEGSKLYYVKMWDENDNLVYLGAASKALNPKTNQEEYCWRSYCQGANNYEFAYHPESETLSYVPYGGGID